jgi:hypothetical protein
MKIAGTSTKLSLRAQRGNLMHSTTIATHAYRLDQWAALLLAQTSAAFPFSLQPPSLPSWPDPSYWCPAWYLPVTFLELRPALRTCTIAAVGLSQPCQSRPHHAKHFFIHNGIVPVSNDKPDRPRPNYQINTPVLAETNGSPGRSDPGSGPRQSAHCSVPGTGRRGFVSTSVQ